MADNERNRLQDGAFLQDMTAVVGALGVAALERINTTLALDYGGIDFGVDARGDILLFEANATMVMIPLMPDQKWAYRQPAFRARVRGRARHAHGPCREQPSRWCSPPNSASRPWRRTCAAGRQSRRRSAPP